MTTRTVGQAPAAERDTATDVDCSISKDVTQAVSMQHRGILTIAKRLRPGDVVVDGETRTVRRTLGVQGRKPKTGAALMKIEFLDGEVIRVREDRPVRVTPANR